MNAETSMRTDSLLLLMSSVGGASLACAAVTGGRGRGRVERREVRRSPAPMECER